MISHTVQADPQVTEMLSSVGRRLPANLLSALRTVPDHSLAAVSDYGGLAPSFRYETYVTYILDWNASFDLVDVLNAFKKLNGIGERSMLYKSRNDRLKARHYGDWVRAFSAWPGLCVAICWDKEITSGRAIEPVMRRFKQGLVAHGIPIKPDVAARMVRKISWLAIVGHLLQPQDKLAWVSDHDEILQGSAKEVTVEAVNLLAHAIVPTPIAALGYMPPLMPEHETLLTLPDLVAGALAAALPHPYEAGRLEIGDSVTADIMRALADFDDAHTVGGNRGRLLPLVFTQDGDEVRLRTLELQRGP